MATTKHRAASISPAKKRLKDGEADRKDRRKLNTTKQGIAEQKRRKALAKKSKAREIEIAKLRAEHDIPAPPNVLEILKTQRIIEDKITAAVARKEAASRKYQQRKAEREKADREAATR